MYVETISVQTTDGVWHEYSPFPDEEIDLDAKEEIASFVIDAMIRKGRSTDEIALIIAN